MSEGTDEPAGQEGTKPGDVRATPDEAVRRFARSPRAQPAGSPDMTHRPRSEPKALPTTKKGREVARALRKRLTEMLDAAAQVNANRRRATAIDTTDFEAAFDDAVNPFPRPRRLDLVADLCAAVGAGFVGYSINIYTGDGRSYLPAHIAMIAGLVLSLVGVAIKQLDLSK